MRPPESERKKFFRSISFSRLLTNYYFMVDNSRRTAYSKANHL